MITRPLVSVICLCYNHRRFIHEAVQSVLKQTYPHIELIIVDDASADDSIAVIHEILSNHPAIKFLSLKTNLGNCSAFNKGLALASGDFIIDFATDDVMLPDRIQKQIDFFSLLPTDYGVVFTDAIYIDDAGELLYLHYTDLYKKGLLTSIPEGDVYADILCKYFISSPTMMVKREVFDRLGGYDENLAYEDFDFWVRSSRFFKYGFLNEALTKVRRLHTSMSTGWYKPGDPQLHSTYLICRKANKLNHTEKERKSLVMRMRYELRQSVFSDNREEATLFYKFLKEISGLRLIDKLVYRFNNMALPLAPFRKLYHYVFLKSG
jgi:glycosyltransferase involved in cell wall biosynthesis